MAIPRAQATGDPRPRLRFDRNELAGAFGDIGTDLPLLVGMILAARLDGASVLVIFGAMQIATALVYRMPMPVQPLKAMAALVIAQKLDGQVLFGAGLAIGAVMLGLVLTGALGWLGRVVPKAVVRGIQLGLGLQLSLLALTNYVRADGGRGYALAAAAFVIVVGLLGNRRWPAAIIVVLLGLIYALIFNADTVALATGFGFSLPKVHVPGWADMATGFLVLALPQIPLSLANSLLATRQVALDLFPDRPLKLRRIGLTYAAMNLVAPFFSGVPVCHGSGGMAGHYAFGARTGGSVLIYGLFLAALGLFFGAGFDLAAHVFPLPMLGVLLVFEGLALIVLVRDLADSRAELAIAVLVAVIAVGLPYGYAVGVVVGTPLYYLARGRFGHLGREV